MFKSYRLTGEYTQALDTEIRYTIAAAKVDGCELVQLTYISDRSDIDIKRVFSCVIKILRVMKKNGEVQFYQSGEDISSGSTEATYLLNKYGSYVSNVNNCVYVKL